MRSTLTYMLKELETLRDHPEVLCDAHRTEVVCAEWIRRLRQALEGTPRIEPTVPRGVVVAVDPEGRRLSVVPPGHRIGQVDRWVAVRDDGKVSATSTSAPPLIRWCRAQGVEIKYLFDLSILERVPA